MGWLNACSEKIGRGMLLMTQNFAKLFEPIKIGSLELKNRYVMNAMHLGFEEDGYPSRRTIGFYQERAKGGVGLIIAGGFKVEKIGGGPTFLGIHDDSYVQGLSELASAVKREGASIFAQLYHAGRYVHSAEIGEQAVSASAVKSRLTGEVPRALSVKEIKEIVVKYSEAASRAKRAGFDGIEVLASTGYLISQFLSPLTNKREDEYGGDLDRRMHFGLEIAEAVRTSVGNDFPVIFRISGNDFMKGGVTNKEAAVFAKALEESGIDAINVQSGWHEARVPTVQNIVPPGAFVYLASGIKEKVSCPVMTCNKLGNPFLAEEVLENGLADMIGLARSFLANPHLPRKVQEGRVDDIVRCIHCNQGCLDMVFTGRPVTCMVNPFVGRETEWEIIPAAKKKKVLVVGGGPAGMEAARIAAMRGHDVHLYEKAGRLGGQVNLATVLPDKDEFGMLVADMENHLNAGGVVLKIGTEATAKEVDRLRPDAVVIASGAEPRDYSIPGSERKNVISATELLRSKAPIAGKVVIVGGGSLGCEVALYAARSGAVNDRILAFLLRMRAETPEALLALADRSPREVTLITRRDKVGLDIGQTTRWIFLQELARLNVRVITRAENIQITDDGVDFETGDEHKVISADMIIISPGMESNRMPYEALKEKVEEIYLIGDSKDPRKALDAIREGAEVGLKL